MDSYKFTNDSIIANLNISFFPVEFQILRYCSYNGSWKYAAIFSNAGSFHNCNITANPCTFSNFNVVMNNSKRINLYILGYFGIRMYVCKRMNHEDPKGKFLMINFVFKKAVPIFGTAAKIKLKY